MIYRSSFKLYSEALVYWIWSKNTISFDNPLTTMSVNISWLALLILLFEIMTILLIDARLNILFCMQYRIWSMLTEKVVKCKSFLSAHLVNQFSISQSVGKMRLFLTFLFETGVETFADHV